MSAYEQIIASVQSYNEQALKNKELLHGFGNDLILSFARFLGERAHVTGVDPDDDGWNADLGDYNDQKFSDHKNPFIHVEPILMGIAIKIVLKEGGKGGWFRNVVELDVHDSEIWVNDARTSIFKCSTNYDDQDLIEAAKWLHKSVISVFESPVKVRQVGRSPIGFKTV